MLTRNFFTALAAGCAMPLNEAYKNVISTSGAASTSYVYSNQLFGLMTTLYTGSQGLFFGTGTTPTTLDDYKPEAAITSGLTASFSRAVRGSTDTYEEYTVAISLTSTNAVTITEMGLVASNYSQSSGSFTSPKFLVERTVLDEPIVFAAGETKTINYTIRFNYPTA